MATVFQICYYCSDEVHQYYKAVIIDMGLGLDGFCSTHVLACFEMYATLFFKLFELELSMNLTNFNYTKLKCSVNRPLFLVIIPG